MKNVSKELEKFLGALISGTEYDWIEDVKGYLFDKVFVGSFIFNLWDYVDYETDDEGNDVIDPEIPKHPVIAETGAVTYVIDMTNDFEFIINFETLGDDILKIKPKLQKICKAICNKFKVYTVCFNMTIQIY
jgi:hypothetical protein